MTYRPFTIEKSQDAPATVATIATLRGEAAQTVATVATVAGRLAKTENPPEPDPRLHFCACGASAPFGFGWSLKAPECARWYCAACLLARGRA